MTSPLSEIRGVQRSVSLAPLTSYKLGGQAAWFVEVNDNHHLDEVLRTVPSDGEILVLGKGSNLLIADRGFPGLVIRFGGEFLEVTVEDGVVVAGGATPLPRVARAGAEAGRAGVGARSNGTGTPRRDACR